MWNEGRGVEKAALGGGRSWSSVSGFELSFPEVSLLSSREFCLHCNQLGPELQVALEFSTGT